MLRDQKENKDNWHYRIHSETKMEMGQTYSSGDGPYISQEWKTIGGPNAAQSGNQGEGRDQRGNLAEDDKTT